MATIGGQLNADILMFGRLQKEGKGYQVTLKVLDVSRKSILKSSSDLVPLAGRLALTRAGDGACLTAELRLRCATGHIETVGQLAFKPIVKGGIGLDRQLAHQ